MRLDTDSDKEGLNEEYGTAEDDGWDLAADRVYWQRRFLILCAGVVALGLCAWLIPGADSPSRQAAAAARQSVAALNKRLVLPPAAYRSAWAGPAPSTPPSTAHAMPAITHPATTHPAITHPAITHPATTHPAAGRPPRPAAGAADAAGTSPCAPAGIVLSLLTSQARYARGARPAFSVYAVSTAAAACTLPFGAGAVRVIVTRDGHVVWDSAACHPAPARPARFTLGVPQLLTLTWNPKATRPAGCGGSLTAGRPGLFEAVAMSHGQSSPVRGFAIAGLSALIRGRPP